jgi:catechol 2,3-dioxygenase-like lactoylglutathione lyase family enzyme
MIDHLSIGVSDLARAGAFYDAVLATIGYVRVLTHERALGWNRAGARDECFAVLFVGDRAKACGEGCHIAFAAPNRDAVDAFHGIAMKNGAIDEGGPGPRPQYGAGYYAAFVRDADGYRIEAVCHEA